MSKHSYSICWLHLIWATLDREKVISNSLSIKLSGYLYYYARDKNIFMKTNYVNSDHVHCLIDLPTKYSIEEIIHLIKGASSYWINHSDLIKHKFSWGRGYGAFSVSASKVNYITKYIEGQEKHHRVKTFKEEFEELLKLSGMGKYEIPGNR